MATYATVSAGVLTLPFLPLAWSQLSSASTEAWLAAIYLGVFPSALGYALWGFCLSRLSLATTTSFLYVVPVVAVGIGYLWLDEVPLVYEIIGGVLTVVGVVILNVYRGPRQRMTNNNETVTNTVA